MLAIPPGLKATFEEYLRNRAIPNGLQWMYRKWLRYYLDFCQKYKFPPTYRNKPPPVYPQIAVKEAKK